VCSSDLLISVGNERYLVPSLSIVEALQPTPAMLSSIGERDELLPCAAR
jgi:chemotaxis protein histidine kinase CheA